MRRSREEWWQREAGGRVYAVSGNHDTPRQTTEQGGSAPQEIYAHLGALPAVELAQGLAEMCGFLGQAVDLLAQRQESAQLLARRVHASMRCRRSASAARSA